MIKFGTDGWRAVIAADFNTTNAKIVFQAIADYLLDTPIAEGGIAIGYDTRFLSDYYAELAASVMAANQLKVEFSESYVSVPNVSWQVFERKLAGGIMISASHNPPRYNGVKFKASYAGSASPEITSRIEAKLGKNPPRVLDFQAGIDDKLIEIRDFRQAYLEKVKSYVDFKRLGASGLRVVFDSMGGAGQGYLETLFQDTDLEIIPLRKKPDPLFYRVNPEPLADNLRELAKRVVETRADLGLAFDGDADRIGGLDGSGEFVSSHQIFALLLKHLVENHQLEGRVIKTVSVSAMVEKLSRAYGLELHETPVGFKYICAEMLKGGVLIGGEESGGIGVMNHIPERDALLNALLLLELIALSGKSLKELWAELVEKYGPHYYQRVDKTFKQAEFRKLKHQLNSVSEAEDMQVADYPVREINRRDGYKFILEDNKGWVMVRISGTEPVLRLYCEARSKEETDKILKAVQKRFFT